MRRPGLSVVALVVPACVAWLGGCAGVQESEPRFGFASEEAPRAFEQAREALLAEGFKLDRVDASAGVITTRPKPTAGLATPWHGEQSAFGQEVEEALNGTQRRVRVSFAPLATGGMEGTVEVEVERIHRRGWNPSTASVTQSTFWNDPYGPERGTPAIFATPIGTDEALARRIAGRVARSLGQSGHALPTLDAAPVPEVAPIPAPEAAPAPKREAAPEPAADVPAGMTPFPPPTGR